MKNENMTEALKKLSEKYPNDLKYFDKDAPALHFFQSIGADVYIGKLEEWDGKKVFNTDVVWIRYGQGGDTIEVSKFDISFTGMLEAYLEGVNNGKK